MYTFQGLSLEKGYVKSHSKGKGNVFCETTPISYQIYVDNATIENLTRENLEHTVGFWTTFLDKKLEFFC